jgi:hypothetical protein
MMGEAELDEAYDQGREDAGHANYVAGYEAGVAWGYKDGKADEAEALKNQIFDLVRG